MSEKCWCGETLAYRTTRMEAVVAEGVPTMHLKTQTLQCPVHGENWRWRPCEFRHPRDKSIPTAVMGGGPISDYECHARGRVFDAWPKVCADCPVPALSAKAALCDEMASMIRSLLTPATCDFNAAQKLLDQYEALEAKRRPLPGEEACCKCEEPTTLSCEGCGRYFCSDHCSEAEETGGGYCLDCYPFGAIVDWGTEMDPKDGDEMKAGTALHFRSCRILKALSWGDSCPPYLWQFTTAVDGAKMLRDGLLKPCSICGTVLERIEAMEAKRG